MDIMLNRVLQLIGSKHGAQKELSDYIGIKSSVITDWKSGKNKSYRRYAPQIAAYYGVSLDWLSGATDEKEQKNIPTLEGEEFVDEGVDFVELPYESQQDLYRLFSDACASRNIAESFAVVRAGLNKNIMTRLQAQSYTMASVAHVRALAAYLSVTEEANAILEKAPDLLGAKLEIAKQMMEQAMRLNLSQF